MDKNSSDDGATSTNATTPLLRSVVVTNGADNSIQDEDEERRRPTKPWQGEFAKSIIYAGLDAIVTSFSLISSISAGRLSSGQFPTSIISFNFLRAFRILSLYFAIFHIINVARLYFVKNLASDEL